jgi:peptide/nickel transport system substrate-binding protein
MKRIATVLSVLMVLSMLLSSCATTATTTPPAAAPATEVPAAPTAVPPTAVVPPTEVAATVAPTAVPAPEVKAGDTVLPRNETLYFNGQQWGSVVCWNPYSSNCNNAMGIAQQDNARVIMFETPYLYDMLDGKQYPLLADGAWAWDAKMTQITF